MICTAPPQALATPLRHRPSNPLVGAQKMAGRERTPMALSPTSDPLSRTPKPKTLLSIPPSPFLLPFVLSSIIHILTPNLPPFTLRTRHSSPAPLRWPYVLLHALPRPTARRAPLAPNLPNARSTHEETPRRPIAHANSYTWLVLPRDVPSISSNGVIACERSDGLLLAPSCCPSERLRALLCWQPQRNLLCRSYS